MAELISSQEATFRVLDFVLNHERKIGAAAILQAKPHETFFAKDLRNSMNEYQGSEQPWPVDEIHVSRYAEMGLVPGGVAVRSEVSEISGVTYRASQEQQGLKRALTGFGVEWSLAYPDLSLQQALGTTQTSGQVRCPRARYQIYGYILAKGDQSIGQLGKNFREIGYKSAKVLEAHIETLESLGIVTVRISDDYNPTLEIKRNKMIASNILPDTMLLRRLTGSLPPGTRITLNKVLDMMQQQYPQVDTHQLRKRIVHNIGALPIYAGLALGEGSPSPKDVTQVQLSKKMVTPITDLYSTVQLLMAGRRTQEFEKTTHLITEKAGEETFAALIAKGKQFSGSYAGSAGRGVVESQIRSLMQGTIGFTEPMVRTALLQEYGRSISSIPLRRILNGMVKAGSLSGGQELLGQNSRFTNVYRIQATH